MFEHRGINTRERMKEKGREAFNGLSEKMSRLTVGVGGRGCSNRVFVERIHFDANSGRTVSAATTT